MDTDLTIAFGNFMKMFLSENKIDNPFIFSSKLKRNSKFLLIQDQGLTK